MPDIVCSLKADAQTIPVTGGDYYVVRFPYGTESYDAHGMHNPLQPDGVTTAYPDPRSGLIWPAHDAWAEVYALLYWEDGDYTELRDRIVRDPLGLFGEPDSTCTEDRAITPGGQFIAKSWGMFVHPKVPLAVAVRHNSPRPVRLALAEFKIAYRT
ncbi:hypothetical protein ACFFMN_34040 [Planobispora siamensis]|uniref:Uncharacterized protein n=1 Tax=Planobispora siamensis TaxID=936338 RepID=A0A8J3WJV7_9ACTN|nr:hypothetical protein [Planobispora siamensis]GIH91925.1 hypothetical protein Psi01_25550 [Planobispora siamensis]